MAISLWLVLDKARMIGYKYKQRHQEPTGKWSAGRFI